MSALSPTNHSSGGGGAECLDVKAAGVARAAIWASERLLPLQPSPTLHQRGGAQARQVRVPDVRGDISPDARFLEGYRSAGGPPEYESHLVNDVLPCEDIAGWGGYYDNGYISRAQFTPANWATTSLHTGLSDPTDPLAVGANVAWWIKTLETEGSHPGGSGGWPVCWNVGVVP